MQDYVKTAAQFNFIIFGIYIINLEIYKNYSLSLGKVSYILKGLDHWTLFFSYVAGMIVHLYRIWREQMQHSFWIDLHLGYLLYGPSPHLYCKRGDDTTIISPPFHGGSQTLSSDAAQGRKYLKIPTRGAKFPLGKKIFLVFSVRHHWSSSKVQWHSFNVWIKKQIATV